MSKMSTVHLVFVIMCCHLLLLDIRDGIQICDDAHVEPIRRTLNGLQLKLFCSYWRSICLSLPQLWSIMFVDADEIFTSIISRKGILQANNYWDFSA
ncbi:hypothetical protein IW261DRAFT_1509519, partial [Armillaria novae-zelandiae]